MNLPSQESGVGEETPGPAPSANGPDDTELTRMLGRSRTVWDELLASVEREHSPVTQEWHFSAKTCTWHVRLKQEARTIVYLLPRDKYFLTAFVFGERAVMEILSGRFPDSVTSAIREARPYPEGRGIRLVTRNRRDVGTMLKLVAIKLLN